jgi:hypothetical protein
VREEKAMEERKREENVMEDREESEAREMEKMSQFREGKREEEKQTVEQSELKQEDRDEDDDIGPDDSVSHFFSGSRIEPPSFPVPPPKRYADAGTVLYSAAPKRVLVKPITLKLENPIQSIQE